MIWNYKNEFIVFSTEHYNSTGIMRSLGEEGVNPTAIILKSDIEITSKSKYIKKLYQPKTIEEGYKILLSLYNAGEEKKIVITSDDSITSYLDQHYDELKEKFYFFNAGEAGRITRFMDKYLICKQAEKHNFKILKTVVVDHGEIPADLEYPIITKAISPNSGGWKKDVFICHSAEELKAAYGKIKSEKVLLQRYIQKKNELCLDGFSYNHGKNVVITISSTYTYTLPDKYSYCMEVTNFKDTELQTKLTDLFADIGFEGIFSVEFLIDSDDELYFSEINFRNSTWSYASTRAGMNLILLWAEAMITNKTGADIIKPIREPYYAMDEYDDFKACVLGRKMSLSAWLKQYKDCDCLYCYNKQDPKPFLAFLYSITRNKIMKIVGRGKK